MAGLVGAVLGITVVAALVVHANGEAVSTSEKPTTHVVRAAATHVPVPTATTAPTRARMAPHPPVTVSSAVHHVRQVRTPAAATPAASLAGSVPLTPSGSGAWLTLDSYAETPGTWTAHVHGGGFAPGETVELRARGAASTPASLVADGQGDLDGSVSLQIPPGATSTLDLLARGEQSERQAPASMSVVPYTAMLSLAPYAALPGQSVDVSGQGYPPNVLVRLQVAGKVVQTVRTDGGGTLQVHAAFTVPYSSGPAHLEVVAISSVGHTGATQTLDLLALRPWAISSTYAVHMGDRVQFDAHGFAAGEPIKVYLGESYMGQSTSPTDGQGNVGGIGPFTVPPNDPQPTYTLVGAQSGARVEVSLTIVP
jgi:hypothetical protein